MYTVLIAEDELLVRIGIASSVPWEQMGMRVVAEAADGATAWEAFLRYHPDIVIADIRMPQMDGIELLRRIRAEDRDCAVIIITNVEHDGTLVEARRIGIADCLLKAAMKRDDITAAVRRARDSLPEGRSSDGVPADNDALWREYLSTPRMDRAAFERRCAQDNAAFFDPEGLILLYIRPSYRLSHRLRSSLVNLFAHRLGASSAFFVLPTESGAVALGREPFDSDAVLHTLRGLARYVRDNFGEELIFVVQAGGVGLDALRARIENAFRYTRQAPFFDSAALLLDASGNPCFAQIGEAARTLRRCAPLSARMSVLLECADDMEQLPGALAAGWTKGRELGLKILAQLQATEQCPGVHALVDALARAADRVSCNVRLSTRREILTAVDYIEDHLSDELTIRQVSEIAGYHPAYFSSLFKQEMGMSYSDFLTRLRIQRAKELLKQSGITMQAVADACGFSDLSYFSYKFKREVGVAPSQWRAKR